jgi:hypothetical protein
MMIVEEMKGILVSLRELKGISKAIVITGIIVIILYYLVFLSPPSIDDENNPLYGQIWGELSAEGSITAHDSLNNRDFGIYGYDSHDSRFQMTISNISSVTVRERKDGGEFQKNYDLLNGSFIIEMQRGSLFCTFSSGYFNYELIEFYGTPQEASRYVIFTQFASMDGEAKILHSDYEEYDIRTYWYVTARVNGEELNLSMGDFILPENEIADVSISGYGIYGFDLLPDIHVNGSVSINDFTETTRKGTKVRAYENLYFEGIKIIIASIEMPELWEGNVDSHSPWVVEINFDDSGQTNVNYENDIRYIIVYIIIIGVYLIYLYSILTN